MKKKKTIRQIVREEVAMAIQEVITELKKPVKVEKPMTPKKRTQNSSFTSNKVLNDVLNELVGRQYGDMMNETPQQVPSNDPMSQFLNKDYREVLDKAKQKQQQKYGK